MRIKQTNKQDKINKQNKQTKAAGEKDEVDVEEGKHFK